MLLFSKFKKFSSMKALSLLKSLAEIESPYGREEKLAKYLLGYLREIGHEAFMEDLNVLLNPEKEFIVATHLDTVKVVSSFSFDGEYAYGTGVCDAKASITAILLALERISKPKFGVALFYDEEGEGKGSENYCKNYKPKMAVVMEPTNLTVANVQYGGLEVNITVKGKAAHGSTPWMGLNAIEECMKLLNEFKKLENVKVSIQQISSGSKEYAIPDECEVRIEFLFKPEIKANNFHGKLKSIGPERTEIEVKDIYDGFISGEVAVLLKKALEKVGVETRFSEMPSWNDSVNLHLIGCDTVVFGPGELFCCHTSEERVRLKDIEIAAEALVALNDLL